jgi:tetratricopeptide (TPR) repeat protein
MDLELEHLAFAERLKYADRLLEISPSLSDQMQYRCVKAVQYFLIGDRKSSEALFAEVVAMGRSPDNQPLARYEHHLFARAVQHLGMLRNDATSLNESIALFNDLILDDDWTPIGRAALTSEIGQSFKFLEDWSGAEKSHLDAIKLHDNAVDRIHLAEALLYQKKIAEACVAIDHLDATTLTGSALEDFALAYAVIAIWHGDKHRLQCALGHLESYQPEEPYFRERRLQLLRSVDKGIVKGKISETEILESTPKGGFLALISKIIMIQPNLGGFGLNFNALMDEIAKRKELDKRPRPERKRDDA